MPDAQQFYKVLRDHPNFPISLSIDLRGLALDFWVSLRHSNEGGERERFAASGKFNVATLDVFSPMDLVRVFQQGMHESCPKFGWSFTTHPANTAAGVFCSMFDLSGVPEGEFDEKRDRVEKMIGDLPHNDLFNNRLLVSRITIAIRTPNSPGDDYWITFAPAEHVSIGDFMIGISSGVGLIPELTNFVTSEAVRPKAKGKKK